MREVVFVATTVTGCVDAIVDGETGILAPPRDAEALAGAMAKLIREPELRWRLGAAAREFVASRFFEQRVNRNLLREYGWLLEREGMSLPEKAKQLVAEGKEEDALEKVS